MAIVKLIYNCYAWVIERNLRYEKNKFFKTSSILEIVGGSLNLVGGALILAAGIVGLAKPRK
ncbi:hypothetical protein GBO41_03650 [Pediococcus acidilactici]|nr:hypothetical protein GBO41_03650 [Pediococcus acidilactici]TLP99906.1 hypothetical protein FEZ49_05335 [Pediococcus acidilactici]